jgi:hypothetical protein
VAAPAQRALPGDAAAARRQPARLSQARPPGRRGSGLREPGGAAARDGGGGRGRWHRPRARSSTR